MEKKKLYCTFWIIHFVRDFLVVWIPNIISPISTCAFFPLTYLDCSNHPRFSVLITRIHLSPVATSQVYVHPSSHCFSNTWPLQVSWAFKGTSLHTWNIFHPLWSVSDLGNNNKKEVSDFSELPYLLRLLPTTVSTQEAWCEQQVSSAAAASVLHLCVQARYWVEVTCVLAALVTQHITINVHIKEENRSAKF